MDSYFFSRFKEYNFLSVLYKKIIREDTSYFHFENPNWITSIGGWEGCLAVIADSDGFFGIKEIDQHLAWPIRKAIGIDV